MIDNRLSIRTVPGRPLCMRTHTPMRPDSAVAPFGTVCPKCEVQERTAWKPESGQQAAHVPNQDVAKQRGCHRQGMAEARAIGE